MWDRTLVSYGYDEQPYPGGTRKKYRLCQHDLETEQLIYSREKFTSGAIEIIMDRKPFLLLSDG